jgi:hypothetical protein
MNDRGYPETIFPTAGAAEYLGRQPQTLRKWRLNGGGPRYIRMGRGKAARVGYRLSDLEAWLEARTFESTSEETAARDRA